MARLKIIQIGNSLGVILPKELLFRLKVDKGDTLFVTDAPGGVTLSAYDPIFERQMRVMREVMRSRRNALRELGR